MIEVVAFTCSLTDTRKDRQPGVFRCDIVDQLHHVDGLADTCATEQTDFTALSKRADQIDNLDTRFQQLVGAGKLFISRRFSMNRHTLLLTDVSPLVNRPAKYVHDPSERLRADRHRHGGSSILHAESPAQTLGAAQSDSAHNPVTQLLLHFKRDLSVVDSQGVVYLGHVIAREFHVDNRANDLYDATATHVRFLFQCGRCDSQFNLIVKFVSAFYGVATKRVLLLNSRRAARDFRQLLSNGGLAGFVINQPKLLNKIAGVVGGIFHSQHARSLFARIVLHHSLKDL